MVVFAKGKLTILFLSALVVIYGLVGGIMDKVSARDGAYENLAIFTNVLSKVSEDYVEPPRMEIAMLGALHGMMEALDPYSSFVPKEEYEKLSAREETGSVGLVVSKRYSYVYIVSSQPEGPADRVGLRSGDMIESIDGRLTTQMSLWEARRMLRGAPGTAVELRVIRARKSPAELELVRQEQVLDEVQARIQEPGIGVIRLPHLEPGMSSVVESKLRVLVSSGIQGLLVDVRSTAQGEIKEAIQVSDLLVAKDKLLTTLRDRKSEPVEFRSEVDPVVSQIPIVVLTNGGTSGAAEVLTAALRDNEVAEVVGDKTDGRGSLQELFSLEGGSVVFLSTQLYFRPNGKPIQARTIRNSGIVPDVQSPSEEFVTNFLFENVSDDPDVVLGSDFYRRLNQAIRSKQFDRGIEQLRSRLLKKVA
jgi:carboxyl-terminal processing protease